MAVTIRFDGDPSGAIAAAGDVEQAADNLGDRLGDASDAGKDAGDAIEEGLDQVGDAAGDAVEEIDEVTESSEGASLSMRSIGKSAKEAVEGDFSGAMGAATGFLRNFGPVGVIAGGLAAGGIGLVTAALDANEEKAAEQAAAAAEWAQAWLDAGGSVITSQQLVAEVRAIATDPERYKVAQQNAEDWGVTVSTAMRAMAGDTLALTAAQTALNARTDEAARLLAIQEVQVDGNAAAAYDLDDATRRGAESLDALYAGMEAGREIARETSDALLEIVRSSGSAALEVDALGNQLFTLPDGTKVVVDAETGQASQNIETFKGDLDGIVEQIDTKAVFTADTSQAEAAIEKLSGKKVRVVAEVVDPYGRVIK